VHLGDARSSPVPSVVAYGDTRWRGRRVVPDIAGEVGSGGDDLETPRRILSSTREPQQTRPGSRGTTWRWNGNIATAAPTSEGGETRAH